MEILNQGTDDTASKKQTSSWRSLGGSNRYCNKSNRRNKGCIRRKLHLLRLSCCRTNENSCRNPMPRKTTVTENRFSNYVILSFVSEAKLKWWIVRDLNPGPTGYEPVALTNWANDPYYYICIYGGNDGIEPMTTWLTAMCSSVWATFPLLKLTNDPESIGADSGSTSTSDPQLHYGRTNT